MRAAFAELTAAVHESTARVNPRLLRVSVVPFEIVAAAPRKSRLVYPPRMENAAKLTLFRQWLHDEIAADRSGPRPAAGVG